MNDSILEFNEYQLNIFLKLITHDGHRITDRVDEDLIDDISKKLMAEIQEVQRAKILLSGEDKMREEIRRRLKMMMAAKEAESQKAKTFKLTGTEADKKLDRPI